MGGDSDKFQSFEQAGWERVAEAYDGAFTTLTTQAIPALLDALRVAPNQELLDVCCGPGFAAAEAARRGARPTGIDFSAAMVERASHAHPGIAFRIGDAQELPFPDASFDAVSIAYGLLHLARPDDALAEARRVLRPGGRIATVVWARPERALGFQVVMDAVRELGSMDVNLPPGPDFFRFSDEAECERSFEAAGFEEVRCAEVSQVWELAQADDLFQAMHAGTVRTGGLLVGQAPEALTRIRARMQQAMAPFAADPSGDPAAGFCVPMPALLTQAVR